MKILIKSRKVKTLAGILLLVTPMLFTSCVSAKAKKCNCPTFGDTKKH